MIAELKNIIQSVNPAYETKYEEAKFYNAVDSDELPVSGKYCLIEEFTSGTMDLNGLDKDTSNAQVYFFTIPDKAVGNDTTAEEREALRNTIKEEMVRPFLQALRLNRQQQTKSFRVTYPISRFDCEEVGIIVEFPFKEYYCEVIGS